MTEDHFIKNFRLQLLTHLHLRPRLLGLNLKLGAKKEIDDEKQT